MFIRILCVQTLRIAMSRGNSMVDPAETTTPTRENTKLSSAAEPLRPTSTDSEKVKSPHHSLLSLLLFQNMLTCMYQYLGSAILMFN